MSCLLAGVAEEREFRSGRGAYMKRPCSARVGREVFRAGCLSVADSAFPRQHDVPSILSLGMLRKSKFFFDASCFDGLRLQSSGRTTRIVTEGSTMSDARRGAVQVRRV